MAAISRSKLRDMIKLEIKSLVDEDVILNPPSIGEPHYMSYQGSEYDDEYDEYDDEYDEYDVYPPQINKMMNIQEGDCGCGTASYENPYTMEREEDYDLYHHDENHMIDNALQSLADLGGSVDVDFDHDHDHDHSSYMARPQLYKIAKYASKLLDMVDEHEELEDWQESKIAQVAQMIGSVYHSLDYDEEYDTHGDMDMHDLVGMIRTGNI